MERIEKILYYKKTVAQTLEKMDDNVIRECIGLVEKTRKEHKQIFLMGNGGSGASCSHIASDFNKGYNLGKAPEDRLRAISLVDNTPVVLSLANDVAYEEIFAEQLRTFLSPGDLVIGLSGSGNSENVIRGAEYAKEQGNTVVCLTAYSGGKLKELADLSLHAPVENMQIAEDIHMILLHLIFWVLCN